jgi:hypothetical protein
MPANPFRTPDFRWGRARFLCEHHQRLSRKWDDAWIRRARDFQRELARHAGDLDHPQLARMDPAVLGAHRIRFWGDERFRWQLEARTVGAQPAAEIAERMNLPLDVVEAYEHLFYYVRDRLDDIDWVAAFVFGPRLYTGFSEDDVELIWKLYSYNYGHYFLELMLATVYGVPSGVVIDDVDAAADFARSFRRAVALKAIPVTEQTAPLFIELCEQAQAISREIESTRVAPVHGPFRTDSIELGLDGLLDSALAAARKAPDDGEYGDGSNTLDLEAAQKNARKAVEALIDDFLAKARKLA